MKGSPALSPAVPAKRPRLQKDQNALTQLIAAGVHRPGQKLRLHLGCGEQHFDGYVNIDHPPSEHTVMTQIAADVFADLMQLNFPAQSVDEIRLHHVFEHFTRPQALALLIRWHEWLKVGGKLHIETPDVMGCAEQLVSDISYHRKQSVLRHCFGSHEAHWANHYDGWHAEKYQQVLARLGFAVECRRWRWPHEPHLTNVDAFGTKLRHLERGTLLTTADFILEESIVAEVASERSMWNVWRQALRDQLANGQPTPTGEVVVKLQGGLGNQMFQYAAGLALARRHQAKFKLDLSFLRNRTARENFTPRDFCLDLFRLAADCEIVPDATETAQHLPRHVEEQFHFDPAFFQLGPAVYLDGYFQSPRFFEPVRAEVLQTFRSFITPLTTEQKALAAKISTVDAVCLNVRRADFVANPVANDYHGVCNENYFRSAAALIRQRIPNAHFFIFSDDIEWCRTADLTSDAPTTLVTHDYAGDRFSAYLQLMMTCRHFILPNSSFGWWAAFLNEAPGKICIVPEPWFNRPDINTTDLIPAGWEALSKNGTPANLTGANTVAVSVVIPCYQQAQYLTEAIASVVAQTFTDWEIIVVNDGSPDATKKVFQESVARWPKQKLRYFEKANGGLADARNAGINIAVGKYILPLDADDKLHPKMLAQTVALLESSPDIAIAYTDLVHFGAANGVVRAAEYDFAKLCQNNQLNYCSLFPRKVWSTVGGYRRFKVMGYEDWDFWISCGERGFKAKRIPEALLFYRTKTSSMLTNAVKHDRELRAQIRLNHPGLYAPEQVAEAKEIIAATDSKNQAPPPLTQEQQLALAEKNTRAALELEPHNLELHRLLARILEAGGRWTEAIAACNPVLVGKPGDSEIRILLAHCFFEINSLVVAEFLLTEVFECEPGNAIAAEWLIKIKAARSPSTAALLFQQTGVGAAGNSATKMTGITKSARRGGKFPESKLAHKYLDGLTGLEIGGSAHNSFGLKSRNVDYSADLTTVFKLKEIEVCGEALKVDVVAPGDELPLPDDSEDFVLSSHVIEHFFDPIKAIKEWLRVVRLGGYVFIIAPHKERTFDRERPRTPLQELLDRHSGKIPKPAVDTHEHYSVWITADLLEVCRHFNWKVVEFQDADDKVGNGFTILIQKELKPSAPIVPPTKSPLVSVIMPTYNRPAQLAEAVRSVLNQSFTDFEIVVVNDAGADAEPTLAALNESGKIISLRHETNRGLAAARNTGIQAARGRYLAYLDDDDLFYPDHLQTLVEFLASRPGMVAYTDANRAHQELTNGQWQTKKRDAAYAKNWDNDQILVDNFVPVLCFMHEKSLLEKSGRFDETLKRHEDWDFWIRLSRHFSFVRIPKITCEFTWRDNGSSMSGQSFAPFLETMRRIHSQYANFASERPDLLAAQTAKREELEELIQCQHNKPKFKVGFLSADPKVTACAYLRLTAPLDHLHARREIEHLAVADLVNGRLNIDEPLLRQVQVLIVQRGLAAFVPYPILRKAVPNPAVKIVFELDDALTLLPPSHQAYQHFQSVRPHLETYLKHADLVTVSTPKLKEFYSSFNENIEVLPNAVDAAVWLPVVPKPTRKEKLTILFSGTVTHEHDLALVEPAIKRIVREFPERVEFLFWGNAPATLKNLRQIKTVADFKPNYKDYAALLKTLPVDLALVPLEVVPFNQAKSPIKWLEYSACKIPGIFTDIEAYSQVVEHGKTGWLVANTADAWTDAIRKLILDDDLRQTIGENAHQAILSRHLLKQNAQRWTQVYERVLALPPKKIGVNISAPKVSVIIPTFNNIALTQACLASLAKTTDPTTFEIIVVDNASTDATLDLLRTREKAGQLRLLANPTNQGFAHACNQGAQIARSPLLLFLNNDTQATTGWLDALIHAASLPDVGIVGAKLLYANNTIQHAGIDWINGVPDHPHRRAAANAPEVNQFRELDMVTGACFMIPRELFLQLAGFDETYQNGVEDIDLCLRVRAAGRKVVYEPKAVIYHLEGQSVGRFNHVNENLKLFFNRWGKLFDAQKKLIMPRPAKIITSSRSLLLKLATSVSVDWLGSFLDHGSLSHVNREMTGALKTFPEFQLNRVNTGVVASSGFENLAREMATSASADAAVTIRHAWPPDWQRPTHGKLVVIQPWEFGALPADWVKRAQTVDEFWVPSNFVRNCYVESGVPAQKVVVVPNGVDAEKFHSQVTPMELATVKKFKFLFVGGTIGRKGPDLLLQAYLKNFTATDDVCLVIKDFGGKSFYAGQTFESQIRTAQAHPNAPEILYLNEELTPDSLPGLYTACDCLVLPYRGEGFGLPALEAMACGLPVIVTTGGATDDFVRDDFAYRIPAERKFIGQEVGGMKLVSPGWLLEPNFVALGEQMRRAFNYPDEARSRGQLASHHAHEFFSWKHSAAIIAQRLRELAVSVSEPIKAAPKKPTPVKLPPVAHIGQLNEARQILGQRKFQAAWETTLAVIAQRPFHPEAFLLLAEIALAAGDSVIARQCARRARELSPDWNAPKQFLKKSLKGNIKLEWLKLPPTLNVQSTISNPSLSVCLIVKNEEKFLGQCLKSIHGLAQQIIVVNTGSTDRTAAIAREFGAQVHSFTWTDDFAAARNAALAQATGDWILMLDADEELPVTEHAHLLADMKKTELLACRLPLVNRGHETQGRSFVPRLFRNVPGIFFTGRIHEQIFPSIIPYAKAWGLKLGFGTAELLHHGYTKELMRDRNKIERNLNLLHRAVEENPEDPNLMMNLGLELIRSEDLAGGIEKYRTAFQLMSAQKLDEVAPELREVLLTQFTSHLYKIRAHDEIVRVFNSPLAKNGGLMASHQFALGLALFELKQFAAAAEAMRQCIAQRERPVFSPINTDIHTAAPQHCLALSLAKIDDATGAETAFQAALGRFGQLDVVKLDYAKFLAAQNRPIEAFQLLHAWVGINPRQLAAWRLGAEIALTRAEFLEFARDWTGEAMQHVAEDFTVSRQRAEVLLLSGEIPAAAELWERLWNSERQPDILAALILCETIAARSTHVPDKIVNESATSRAFIKWYQRLIAMRAHAVVQQINERLDALSPILPTAAVMLEKALGGVMENLS